MRALVTGGAGFLGSHLCDALLARGDEVLVVDTLLTGNYENLPHGDSRIEFHDADVCEPFDFGPVDYVFHFALSAGAADYLKHGLTILRTGSFGTFNALDLARKYNAKFLLPSGSEIYGDAQVNPQPEDYWGYSNTIGSRSTYTEAMRLSEVATVAYWRYYGLDIRIARLYCVYGPRMRADDGRMISTFLNQALRDEDLTINGDGNQTRSPTYVSDAVEGILRLAAVNEHGPVNMGWPGEISVLQCAREVLAVTGSKSKLKFCQLPEDDARRRYPDMTKARTLLNWEPTVDLSAGLRLCLNSSREVGPARS